MVEYFNFECIHAHQKVIVKLDSVPIATEYDFIEKQIWKIYCPRRQMVKNKLNSKHKDDKFGWACYLYKEGNCEFDNIDEYFEVIE